MCVFCDIVSKELKSYIVYENDKVIAFLDNAPINEGHILLIPKKHYLDVDELPVDILSELMMVSQELVKVLKKVYDLDGYSIMQNGGMFNDIGHYHLHIFPRYINDDFSWISSNESFEYSEEIAEKLANAMNE